MKPAYFLAALFIALAPVSANSQEGPPRDGASHRSQHGKQPKRQGVLSGIFGGEKAPNAGPCPMMGVLYDSSRLVEFAAPEERFANVAYTAEMRGVHGLCRYTGSNPIEMDLEIDMAFGKGPAAQGTSKTYRYWVAVTRANLTPIEKQYFDIKVDFPRSADRMAGTEKIDRIIIPRANDTISGANFEVLVGFELTPEQLAFNRSGKRFRVDIGQPEQDPSDGAQQKK